MLKVNYVIVLGRSSLTDFLSMSMFMSKQSK